MIALVLAIVTLLPMTALAEPVIELEGRAGPVDSHRSTDHRRSAGSHRVDASAASGDGSRAERRPGRRS